MATPACSQHPDVPGVIIVSFLDPSVEEPTVTLCEECAPPMAATLLQVFTGRDVMAWLFSTDEPAKETPTKRKRSPKKQPTAETNGHSPDASSEVPTDTADETKTADDEAVVASIDS